jgi:hypothetical protein
MSNSRTIQAVKSALSVARLSTFEAATVSTGNENYAALNLYAWNARVSAALLAPLHMCEVILRNAVSDALEGVYGMKWPWSRVFEHSLSAPSIGYSPRKDLVDARRNAASTGKVIPELKFVFWQRMFTERHDVRLWNTHLMRVLPNLDSSKCVGQLRQDIYQEIEQIRRLRNRIAHHEPIFTRELSEDFQRMVALVEFRCGVTAAWMIQNQDATGILRERGFFRS